MACQGHFNRTSMSASMLTQQRRTAKTHYLTDQPQG
jgi:hypothetical protein